jgi:hypothetical protein
MMRSGELGSRRSLRNPNVFVLTVPSGYTKRPVPSTSSAVSGGNRRKRCLEK